MSNQAPTDLRATGGTIAENASRAVAGKFTVVDPDTGDRHVLTVDDARFQFVGRALRLKTGAELDHEASPTIDVLVTATDLGGLRYSEVFTITIRDVNEAPDLVLLTGGTVLENDTGAVVGTLAVTDPDLGDSVTLTVDDARFAVVGDRLKLRTGESLGIEDDGLVVSVTATDAGGLTTTLDVTIDVRDADARTLVLGGGGVDENARRVTVGEFSIPDARPGEVFSYSVTDRRFRVDGETLRLVSNFFDFEATPSVSVEVTVTEAGGGSFTQDVTITVRDVNEAPSIVSGSSSVTVLELQREVETYGAVDPDAGDDLTYFIVPVTDGGGLNASLFEIDADTGVLSFIAAPPFIVGRDSRNPYLVTVGVTDEGGLTATRDIEVRVTNIQEDDGPFGRRIDFAPSGAMLADAFLADNGEAFTQARGYGWVTEASVADGTRNGTISSGIDTIPGAVAERPDDGLVEERLRTYAHFALPDAPAGSAQRWAWEHTLRDGFYFVRVAIGDVGGPNNSRHVLNMEGVNYLNDFVPSANLKTVLVTGIVEVTDGRLTLDSIGGDNTKIQSVRIERLVEQDTSTPGVVEDYTFVREALAVIGGEDPRELNLATGIDPNVAFSIGIGNTDPDDPVDIATINTTNVRLFETLSGTRVVGTVNTDAAGGTITFQPSAPLKQNTSYTLTVDGVKTVSREDVLPSVSSFATGNDPNGEDSEVAFRREEMSVSATTPYASIVISPDGDYLYATSLAGTITRWEIDDETGVLLNEQVFAPAALAGRALIGLVFDPENPDVLWITNNDPLGSADATDFTGKITRITFADGPGFNGVVEDYVVGLPRSVRDHLSNSLTFHDDGDGWRLYMTQGSNSATGAPDNSWGNRPERLLTAAVLEIDPRRDVSGGPINVQTQDPNVVLPAGAGAQVGFYNPFAANAPVQIYASGVRNAYDLVFHSNGHLYVPTNGSAAGGNTPDDPNTPANEALVGVGPQNDYLFDVREGFYYGHPNPLRGEYILNGGNPTAGDDGPGEIAADSRYPGYPVGVTPPADYDGFAYNFSIGRSTNGAVEYLSNAFGGALRNALLVVEYSGGKDIVALRFDAAGNVIDDDENPFLLADAAGTPLRFANPLDIATDAATGRIYVVQLNGDGGAITLLTPTDRDAPPVLDRILEAEDAVLSGGDARVATNQPNFTGTGFVDFRDRSGETITWTFDVAQAGIYRISFRYALALKDRDIDGRPLTLAVNGVNEATLPFLPNAQTFREWDFEVREVEFRVGSNTVSVTSIGDSGPNLDHLAISPTPLTAVNTRPTLTGDQADVSFTVGAPIAFVADAIFAADVDPGDVAGLVARLVGGAPLPAWLEFDPGTNQFSSNQSEVPAPGIYEIEIVASDGQAESLERATFAIEIVRSVNPTDVDADGTLNAADLDDDNDGVRDINDPFQADPRNGMGTMVGEGRRFVFDFTDRPFGADPGYGLGITGLHLSGGRTPEQLGLGSPNLTIGGGVLHIEDAGTGDLATGDLTLGAQFGIDAVARFVRISATFDHPFDTRAPARGANFGLLIGTGDADDYVKFVLEGRDANSAFLQMETRIGGVRQDALSPAFGRTSGDLYRVADGNDTVTFTFDLDTVTGQLTASWSVRNGPQQITGSAPTITLTGDLLRAVQGDYTLLTQNGTSIESGLSVGIVASSRNTSPKLDVDVLDITVEGLVADPEITLVSGDSPLLGNRVVFNFIALPSENTGPPGANPPREYKDTATVFVRNDGNDTLVVTNLLLDGPFRFIDGAQPVSFSLEAGESIGIGIRFDNRPNVYDPEEDPELFTGALRVFSNDADEAVATADLAGFYQTVPEGGQEPDFNELMEIFGLGTRADQRRFDNFDLYQRAGDDEVLSPYWQIANGFTSVTVTQLAAFHDISIAAFFLYEPGNNDNGDSIAQLTHDSLYNQSLLPLRTNGTLPTITFDANSVPDVWVGDDVFGFRVAQQYSDPTLNTPSSGEEPPPGSGQRGHFMRFYVAKDEAGNVIADTYVVAQDYQGINYDYQDNLYLVQGIRPADNPLE